MPGLADEFFLFWDGGVSGEPTPEAFVPPNATPFPTFEDAYAASQNPPSPQAGSPWILAGNDTLFGPSHIRHIRKLKMR